MALAQLSFDYNDWTMPDMSHLTWWEIEDAYGLVVLGDDAYGVPAYEIFDEDYRSHLNETIRNHFYYRRIAANTPQMFVYYLNRKLSEIMPTYNAIYKAKLAENFDPLATRVYKNTGSGTGNSDTTGTSEASATSTGTSIFSDTPASYLEQAKAPKYMTNLTQTDSESSNTGTTTGTSNSLTTYLNDFTERSGYLGEDIISMIASGFMATDLMVCDELECCFLQFWTDEPL